MCAAHDAFLILCSMVSEAVVKYLYSKKETLMCAEVSILIINNAMNFTKNNVCIPR